MERVIQTAGCSIYCGDELARAAERSFIDDQVFATQPRRRFARVSHVLKDIRNTRYRELIPDATIVTGTERDSGEKLTIRFSGTLRVVDFCSHAILGNSDYQRINTRSVQTPDADILVSDHPLSNPLLRWGRSFRIPNWIRQQLPIGRNWTDTVAGLSSGLHKEISRILRRHQYDVRISTGMSTLRNYYRELHAPYLTKRFGNSAILPSETAFLSQSRHMIRLDLIYRDKVVAASLLDRQHSCLAIRSSSMYPGAQELAGRADSLDYFSLLIGQLLGCETLDFGLSRPHLEDGPFRYKAKWGTILSPSGRLKSDIRIAPMNGNEATLAFLRRNFFVQRAGDGFFVRVLYGRSTARQDQERIATLRRSLGIASIELAYADGQAEPEFALDSGLSSHLINGRKDPLAGIVAGK